jgi:major membrane immunogen (membrane-anchored lipoprotein)
VKRKFLTLVVFSLIISLFLAACSKDDSMDHGNMDQNSNKKQADTSDKGMNHGDMKSPSEKDNSNVEFSFNGNPESGKQIPLNIQVKNKDGQPIMDFEVEHEKLMHLIVVSKDLSYFDHIHPEYKGNGLFTVTPNFPSGGEYKLFADFTPKGESKTVKSTVVTVAGNKEKATPLTEDKELTNVVDGKEVTLKFDHLMAGMDLTMTFTIKDAKTKQPITNLQPYLGAVGHVVAISGDTETYLHVHPMDEKATGPDAKFMTGFPKSGLYKIWGQFQLNGKVFTVPFTINVPK